MSKLMRTLESKKSTFISVVFLGLGIIFSYFKINTPINLIWISILISGTPMIYSGFYNLFINKKIKSSLLVAIAIISSILIGELFAAAEIAILMVVGEILEDFTVNRARKGIKKLISLIPVEGRRIVFENGIEKEEKILAKNIKRDEIFRIFVGENIPVDGIIISGETAVNQSILTGESLPVDKIVGDKVYSGTTNLYGVIEIKATTSGNDTSMQKLVELVKNAENEKAPTQRIVDKWAVELVPTALFISLATFIIMSILGFEFIDSITRAVTVLVVFCPCALFLSTPTSIMAAIGQATKNGVIVKTGYALEKMGKANVIAFDKTGTLTEGKLTISDIFIFDKYDQTDVLKFISSAEQKSEHPIGKAIVEYAKTLNVEFIETNEFKTYSGKGIECKIDNFKLKCGNERFFIENNIDLEIAKNEIELVKNQGKVIILISVDDSLVGLVALSDVIKENAILTIEKLKKLNTNIIMLTGDNAVTANYFSNKLGITNVKSDLLPENKLDAIRDLKINNIVCMVGDGVNDAPALKLSDVSISMGSMGSDVALESSDILLIGDDISKIPYLKKLSNATIRTIKFNIFASLMINIIAIIMSTFGFLNPVLGAFVHNAGSIIVILNATFLYDRNFNINY